MKVETVITFAALAIAGAAIFFRPSPKVTVDGGNALAPLSVGAGPTFNFGSGNGNYMGNGAYPPFNSCGCGRSMGGVSLTSKLAPIYGQAVTLPQGVKKTLPVIEGEYAPVKLVGDGAYA